MEQYARPTDVTGGFALPVDFMDWRPSCHHRNLETMGSQFLNLEDDGSQKLLYVFGHSYEFDSPIEVGKSDSWYIIENFAALVKDRSDLWKATNGEIFDYIKAQQSLIIKDSTITNPSETDIYLKVDGKNVIVKANSVFIP